MSGSMTLTLSSVLLCVNPKLNLKSMCDCLEHSKTRINPDISLLKLSPNSKAPLTYATLC